jgi:hypothetical protein
VQASKDCGSRGEASLGQGEVNWAGKVGITQVAGKFFLFIIFLFLISGFLILFFQICFKFIFDSGFKFKILLQNQKF